MVCQSLWADGDLDLRNNYASDDGARFGAAGLEVGLHARENRRGELFPAHDIGVSLVLMPLYVLATEVSSVSSQNILSRFRMTRGLFAYSLLSLCIIALVVTAATITRAALIAQGTTRTASSTIVIALWLSPPLLSNSFLVFPEPFALFVTAFAVYIAFGDNATSNFRDQMLILAIALGFLPWFHRKYVIYAAMLPIAVLWSRRPEIASLSTRDRLFAAAVYLVPQIGLVIWSWYQWGNPGGGLLLDATPFSWDAFGHGSLGLFVDRENGLFVWAPVYALIPAAWALGGRKYLVWLLPVGALYFMSAAHSGWWGGFSPAGRYLVPLSPIAACVATIAWRRRLFRYACVVLLIPQIFISADGWQHTRSLWPQGDGHNRILSDLLAWIGAGETMLPSLRVEPESSGRAALWVGAFALINFLVWMRLRRRHGEGRHITATAE